MSPKIILIVLAFITLSACGAPVIVPTATATFAAPDLVLPQILFTATPTATPVVLTPTPTAMVDPTPSGPVFYTVQAGDTLAGIAARFNIDMAGLAAANYLADPDYINTGQQLLIATTPITSPEPVKVGKQIIVILSEQKTYAYENGVLLKEFLVSTGTWDHPTVTGPYAIWIKLESTRMEGPGYDLPNVPWTMYFFQGYGFHGTYWHNNFGTPMSHGCVNMRTEDAKWLFDWAEIGTPVLVNP